MYCVRLRLSYHTSVGTYEVCLEGNIDDDKEGQVNWLDIIASNYIERPDKIEDIYLYEFILKNKLNTLVKLKIQILYKIW